MPLPVSPIDPIIGSAGGGTIAIVGYGNPLRGDDRAGAEVIERLRASAAVRLPDGAIAIAVHQLLPELAELLSRVDHAIFIDAKLPETDPADSQSPPARLFARALTCPTAQSHTQSRQGSRSRDFHRSDPQGLLDLTWELYGRAPREAWLLGIPARDFGFGARLSPVAARGVERAIDWIVQNVARERTSDRAPEAWAIDIRAIEEGERCTS